MRWFMFSVFLMILPACGLFNPVLAGGPYQGKVIDTETKEPIVGAVVLVYWRRLAPGIGHGPAEGFLDAEEVLTDSNGEFVAGKNSPASLIPGTWVSDPTITIFYPGYGHFPHFHTSPPRPPTGWKGLLQMMEQQSVIIELPKLKTREEYRKACTFLSHTAVPNEKKPNLLRMLRQGGDPCDKAFR